MYFGDYYVACSVLTGKMCFVLQGIHHGLGRGCGAVIGGIFVNSFGTTATFRGYGFFCMLVLAAFIFINFYRKEQGFVSDIPQTEDPRQVKPTCPLFI